MKVWDTLLLLKQGKEISQSNYDWLVGRTVNTLSGRYKKDNDFYKDVLHSMLVKIKWENIPVSTPGQLVKYIKKILLTTAVEVLIFNKGIVTYPKWFHKYFFNNEELPEFVSNVWRELTFFSTTDDSAEQSGEGLHLYRAFMEKKFWKDNTSLFFRYCLERATITAIAKETNTTVHATKLLLNKMFNFLLEDTSL